MKLIILVMTLLAPLAPIVAIQEPPRQEPTEMCNPSHLAKEHECHCLAMGGWKDCREGHKQTDTQMCKSYCNVHDFCGCCKAVKQ